MSPQAQITRPLRPMVLHKKLRPLLTQMTKFGLVGGGQLVIDWLLFVMLSWAGLSLIAANLLGRIGGASLGFWLNGKYTFSSRQSITSLNRVHAFRFLTTWVLMSVLSSMLVWAVGNYAGVGWAWIAKPVADVVLALASFFISKYWIYR